MKNIKRLFIIGIALFTFINLSQAYTLTVKSSDYGWYGSATLLNQHVTNFSYYLRAEYVTLWGESAGSLARIRYHLTDGGSYSDWARSEANSFSTKRTYAYSGSQSFTACWVDQFELYATSTNAYYLRPVAQVTLYY